MPDQAPLFILSCERSGSTLLHYILDSHPDICCPGELYMGQMAKLLRLAVSRTTGFITPGTPEERDQKVRLEVHGKLDGMMRNYSDAVGKKFWCDKTPFNINDLKHLEWAFPGARYICLYRHSLDVVQSCLGLQEKGPIWWSVPYVAKNPANYASALLENWVEKNENLMTFEKDNPRAYRILYEDLVKDPEKALAPLFKFLELDWDRTLLERVFKLPHDPGGGDYKIQMTVRIEKDRVGCGNLLESQLLSSFPTNLLKRQKVLHLELGYP